MLSCQSRESSVTGDVHFAFCISRLCLYLSSSACTVVWVYVTKTLRVSYTVNRVGFSSTDMLELAVALGQ